MSELIHLIYSSAANHDFSEKELEDLLTIARKNNAAIDVTGMLLYTDRSFFQILEGESETVMQLYAHIAKDKRHSQVVIIIKEPLARRAFGEWSMGYAAVKAEEIGNIVGLNDFFMQASCFGSLDQGRAKKLLTAFKDGRWRSKVKNSHAQTAKDGETKSPSLMRTADTINPNISFAFQPIIDTNTMSVYSFEALVTGKNQETSEEIIKNIGIDSMSSFDTTCRASAIKKASILDLKCNLNLNFLAHKVDDAKNELLSTLETAKLNGLDANRIVFEIDQDRFIGNIESFGAIIDELRMAGFKFSIDHFGEGKAGLNLLEPYHPDMISLSKELVEGIESNGPRQAVVRGIAQTCSDLGIEIVIKYVETEDEYLWFRDEGFNLFQGGLFAKPGFESLPKPTFPKE